MMKDGQEFRVIDENCWSPVARLADMNKTGWTIKSWQTQPVSLTLCICFDRCFSSSSLYCTCDVQLLGKPHLNLSFASNLT